MASWFVFAAVAGAFGGLIAFGVQHIQSSVANWKLLFIIEGIPTVMIGFLAMVVLPNRPEETTMFNEKEREIALDRANRGVKADVGRVVKKGTPIGAFGATHRPLTCRSRTYPRCVQGLEGMS